MKTKLWLPFLLMLSGRTFAGWEPIPPLPEPNGGFACGAVDRKIVVVGGTNWKDGTKRWLDTIWVYDTRSQKWSAHGKLPHPLACALTTGWNGDMIIAGGTTGTQPCKEVWRMDRSLNLTRVGELSDDAVLPAGGVVGDELFLLGGCADPSKLTGYHGRGVRLNLEHGLISAAQPPGDVAFALAASVVTRRELLVFGGVTTNSVTGIANLNAAWAFDVHKNKWRSLRPFPIAVRGAAAVRLDEQHILIAGGYASQSESFTPAAFIYDARRDVYSKTMDLPVGALLGLVRFGDFVYALGGEDKARHRIAVCFRVRAVELLEVAQATRLR